MRVCKMSQRHIHKTKGYNWLEQLSEKQLIKELPAATQRSLKGCKSTKDINGFAIRAVPLDIMSLAPEGTRPDYSPNFWSNFKHEMYVLICTNDRKYAALRKKLAQKARNANTVVVSTIASAFAAKLGFVAGALVPLVAFCLVMVLRVGKETWCTSFTQCQSLCGQAP
jgi:hypothetical protein